MYSLPTRPYTTCIIYTTEVIKTKKKRKKRPAVVTGGMHLVDQDEWGGFGRGGSDNEGMYLYAT